MKWEPSILNYQSLNCTNLPSTKDKNFYSQKRKIFALSRQPNSKCEEKDECFKYNGSHDSFIFAPPLHSRLAKEYIFTQNNLGAENIVIYEMKKIKGYNISNPCKSLKAWHQHCVAERHYPRKGNICRGQYRIGSHDRCGSASSRYINGTK